MNLRSILCRKRQQRHNPGELVRLYETRIIAKVEAYRRQQRHNVGELVRLYETRIIAKVEAYRRQQRHNVGELVRLYETRIIAKVQAYRAIIANIPAPEPEKWQPKQGEWCCFWDDTSNVMLVSQFGAIRDGEYKYMCSGGAVYKNCAPFTGELPDHLKEVKS